MTRTEAGTAPAELRRRWLQFSLRSLLMLMLLWSVLLSLWAACRARTLEQRIIGTWTAVSERVGYDLEGVDVEDLKQELGDYSITFNKDGTYSSVTWGMEDSGRYRIDGDEIALYDVEEDLNHPGSFIEGWVELGGNTLTLTLPAYPKITVYRKQRMDSSPAAASIASAAAADCGTKRRGFLSKSEQ